MRIDATGAARPPRARASPARTSGRCRGSGASISCMTSSAESESRLPVGSSAKMTAGSVRQRARDRHALLLAARQLARPVPQAILEPDHLERAHRPPPRLADRPPGQQQRQLDVLERVQAPAAGCSSERRSPRAARGGPPSGHRTAAPGCGLRAGPRPLRSPPARTGSAAASSCRSPTARRWRRSRRARCAG